MQYSISRHSSIYFHYPSTFLLDLITLSITKTILVTDKNFLSREQTLCLDLHSFPTCKYGLKFITLEGKNPNDLFLSYTRKILAYSHDLACLSTKSSPSLLYHLHNLVSTREELLSLRFSLKNLNNMNNNKTKNSIFIFSNVYVLALHYFLKCEGKNLLSGKS